MADIAGNIGGGYLTGVIERTAARLRQKKGQGEAEPPEPEAVRDALAADLLAALEKGGTTARKLNSELTDVLRRIDGFEAAVHAAGDDLRSHLLTCFTELAA
jgi:hypothetical protein